MRPTTRFLILEYLRKNRTASGHELSRALGMTGANIRHHLAVLESNRLIESISHRQEGRGRPIKIYGLSRRVVGDGLEDLARAILDVFVKSPNGEAPEASLRSIALRLAGETSPVPERLVTRRLNQAVDRLNELHYQARWEAGVDGPHLILGECPYSAIITDFPELCRMDEFLLEQRTGLPAEQTTKLQPSTKGYPFCTFKVSVKK
jgi:predicted ArsR family transcriptional regulator